MAIERTFLMVKPDGVQRGLVGEIISRFEKRGWKMVAAKFTMPTTELLEEHYAEHKGKPFLPGLVSFMASGPVMAMVWEGANIISQARKVMGATNPNNADVGTIRADYCVDMGRNVIHGSDGPESAAKEIALWFSEAELVSWKPCMTACLYE
eukprot:Protomagalhaensia_wolfi_Nauph_80__4027@NODE_4089_length_641_cov_560_528239_g3243_i0_p1_GENE_NODE_4089_length_641_cov_560_528239_g3243_i0NODE_4089_length_641_cov_560_528239_g3243_i0_p1_ORF_typecomplete_len152_score22_84NDK/PF00334_19/3_2e56_NODE_4089_length_641_cov_560_528239_g3243_i097552